MLDKFLVDQKSLAPWSNQLTWSTGGESGKLIKIFARCETEKWDWGPVTLKFLLLWKKCISAVIIWTVVIIQLPHQLLAQLTGVSFCRYWRYGPGVHIKLEINLRIRLFNLNIDCFRHFGNDHPPLRERGIELPEKKWFSWIELGRTEAWEAAEWNILLGRGSIKICRIWRHKR